MSAAAQPENDNGTHRNHAGSFHQGRSTGGECIYPLEETGQIGGDFIHEYIKLFKQSVEQHPPNYGDAESVMDFLFWQYIQHESCDNEKIRNLFAQLRELAKLPPTEYDEVFYVVSDLCLEYGRVAFQEGMKLAIALMCEIGRNEVL